MSSTIPLDIFSINDKEIPQLADFKGMYVLLLFFNRGCNGCIGRAIPFSLELKDEFPELQIIGIHSQFGSNTYTKAEIQEIVDYYNIPYPIVEDNGHHTYDMYKAEGTPHWVLLDKDGVYKSFFGSMGNAQNRLYYTMSELF